MIKKIIMFFGIVLLSGCEQPVDKINDPIPHQKKSSYTLQSEDFSKTVNLTGNVEAKKEIPISAKIIGRIDSVYVDTGDVVKHGQILARYSSLDNDSFVKYQNSLSQFKSIEAASQNSIKTAEVNVKTQKQALEQIKKEEAMQRKKQYNDLYTNAKLAEITISNAINFLDENIGGSKKFRGTNPYANIIGSNNIISKNNLKTKTQLLVNDFENFTKTVPTSEQAVLSFAKDRLIFLNNLKSDVFDFDSLIRKTVVSSNFSENTKNILISETTNQLNILSSRIATLESLISGTNVLGEQLELKIISAKNAVENSQSNLELAKSTSANQIVAAKSQVNIAANSQQEMIVKAPFSGVITNKNIDIGQLISTGQTMFRIADVSGFKIKTNIADKFVGIVKKDMPVNISVDGLDQKFTGKISKINPSLDIKTRKLGIEITFNNNELSLENLKIGLFTRIKIETQPRKTFFVPRNFINFDFNGATITTSDKKIIPIEILEEEKNKVEISFDGISDEIQIIQE